MNRVSFHAGVIGFLYGVMAAGFLGCLALHRYTAMISTGVAITLFSIGLIVGYSKGKRWRR